MPVQRFILAYMDHILARLASDSFYHLSHASLTGSRCQGLACFAARQQDPAGWILACQSSPTVFCLGQCYRGPARQGEDALPHIASHARASVLLGNVANAAVLDLAAYCKTGGGQALHQVMRMDSAAVIQQISASGLRGRGGAAFPAGLKWQLLAAQEADCKYLVANADEGDPGSFSDRLLMERDPYRLIEAMLIAGITVGARQAYIYLRREYEQTASILQAAIEQVLAAGWLGQHVLGSAHAFDIHLVIGKGSYLCGEETAMLNAIEDRRPEARLRPPQITELGLYSKPTLVNNVETLCAIPWIITHGAAAYAALGTPESPGTKLLSLNSVFKRPGLYEVEFGISLRDIVDKLGMGLKQGQLKGLMIGGPLAGVIPPQLLDTPLAYQSLQQIGGAVGHGGVIAFDDSCSIAELVAQVFRFGAFESCGKCTPCHRGAAEISRHFDDILQGGHWNADRWQALVTALADASLCGHGRGLAEFAQSIQCHYHAELQTCFTSA